MDRKNATKPVDAPPRGGAWRRWPLRIAILLVLYTVLGFLVVPPIVRAVAASQLRKLLERDVKIEKVRFNPFTFVAEVDGLAITDPDGEELLAWKQVRVDFQFTSIFHGPWRVREITIIGPAVRAQINPDYSFNFSDLIEKFGSSDESDADREEPAPMPLLVIDSLEIRDGTATYADLTASTPFRLRIHPVNLRAPDFSTVPGHTNNFDLQGATDAGGQFSFAGSLLLTPPEIHGRFDLQGLNLTNFTALYQDFARFQVRDGAIALATEPHLRLSSSNRLAQIKNTRFALRDLKVGLPDATENLAELDALTVEVPSADAWQREAHVRGVLIDGVRLAVHREPNRQIELIEAAKPTETTHAAPGSAQLVFTAFTNAIALFSGNTNVGVARLDAFVLTNAAVNVLDDVPTPPVRATVSDIALTVRNVSTLPDAAPTARLSLVWQTNGPLAVELTAKVNPPTLEVAIDLERWDLSVADAYLADFARARLDQAELSINGRARLEVPDGAEPSGGFEGEVHLANLKTLHHTNDAGLLGWDALSVRGIKANLHPLGATIDQIEVVSPILWGILHPNGTVNLLTAANITNSVVTAGASTNGTPASDNAPPADASPAAPAAAASPPTLPPVYIATLLLTNGVLHLADEMSEPHARITVNPLNVVLRHLSTTNLQSGDFEISGKFEPAGTFKIDGAVRPLDGPEPTWVTLITQWIDLAPTSPYVQRFLGFELDRGAVSTDLRYTVTQRQLQGTNNVVLDQFTLGRQVESPDAFKLPIKLGLKILQDREGRINLTVPVEGSLDDPQFNLGQVISGAFANLFTKVLISPFSILGGLVGGGDQEELDRVEFEPGESNLDARRLAQVGKIEKILHERPALALELLGTADPDRDGEAIRQARLAAMTPTTPAPQPETQPAAPGESVQSGEPAYTDAAPPDDDDYARNLERRFLEAWKATMDAAALEAKEDQAETTPAPVIEITQDDLRQLAQQRAEAVRAAILESGRIQADRVTIQELAGPPPRGIEVRLSLQ
ncbi:MAG: DUF748 domain-containing protein [Verrucomicrobia bacterium]|nr:DUF748 domain-containing protein [Verrucomicrobiota bacterium]